MSSGSVSLKVRARMLVFVGLGPALFVGFGGVMMAGVSWREATALGSPASLAWSAILGHLLPHPG